MQVQHRRILMFFPQGGVHPQDAFNGTHGAVAARHWEFYSAEIERGDDDAPLLHRSSRAACSVAELVSLLKPDGIVVWQDALTPGEVGALLRGGKAGGAAKGVVFVDCGERGSTPAGIRVGRVRSDPASIASIAAGVLLSSGYSDFAFAPYAVSRPWSTERGDAFARCIEIAGKRFHRQKRSGDHGGETLARWLGELPKPCGIFAANDAVGEEIAGACAQLGISVPDDIAVIGVDDYEYFCEASSPTLSSIALDLRAEGRAAVELLEALMADARRKKSLRFVPALGAVRRASTRFARDRRVARALEFIRLNACSEKFSPRAVVSEMGVSRALADRIFRTVVGHTILEEIHAVRLTRARELLLLGRPGDVVAAECGYASHDDFRRVFRRRVGTTAWKWARENRS